MANIYYYWSLVMKCSEVHNPFADTLTPGIEAATGVTTRCHEESGDDWHIVIKQLDTQWADLARAGTSKFLYLYLKIAQVRDTLSPGDVWMIFLLGKENHPESAPVPPSPCDVNTLHSIADDATRQAYVVGHASFDLTKNEIEIRVRLQHQ